MADNDKDKNEHQNDCEIRLTKLQQYTKMNMPEHLLITDQ